MELPNEDFTAHVLLEPLETGSDARTVLVIAEVVASGFVGVSREVRFDRAELRRFAGELAALQRNAAGRAAVAGMPPGMFSWVVENRGGTLISRVEMRKRERVAGEEVLQTLTAAFEPDPEAVAEAVEALVCLIEEH